MRYLIYGAGAVGGTIGGRLAQHGQDVTLVARGAHLDALRADGLTLADPDSEVTLRIPAAASSVEAELAAGDVAVLATKTQDADGALRELASAAPDGVSVVCATNGVECERLALRRFEHVYGLCVMLPASHLEPGRVEASSTPVSGILDVGRYPAGVDSTAEAVAADLAASSFVSEATPDVMRRKYAKLVMNLGNAIQAACGAQRGGGELYGRAKAEALACFAAAGVDAASDDEDRARRGDLLQMRPVGGRTRGGGSSWQSLARGTGSIEADYLNGEIVLLGRQHGVATPVNAMLQETANWMAREAIAPGSLSLDDLLGRLGP